VATLAFCGTRVRSKEEIKLKIAFAKKLRGDQFQNNFVSSEVFMTVKLQLSEKLPCGLVDR
jgi:hypothetical protein